MVKSLMQIKSNISFDAVKKIAVNLLARREHTKKELIIKLSKRNIPLLLIDEVIEDLVKIDLLNEDRYLESFIRSRVNSGYGPCRIRQELHRKGILKKVIDESFACSNIDWNSNLLKIWKKKFIRKPENQLEYAKQMRFLIYRGYTIDSIRSLID